MENLISSLLTVDIKIRLSSIEKILLKLNNKPHLNDMQKDLKLRLMSNTISCLKDANPKIVLLVLDCLQIFLESNSDTFQPLINMSFELLLAKFSDSKQSVRLRSTEVMISMINMLGLSIGVDKILNHLSHRNFRVSMCI
jgi:hypothetical protein